jgi:dTDP-4-dehydrorhamnose reductase
MEAMKIIVTGASSKTAEAFIRIATVETDYELVLISREPDKLDYDPRHRTYAASVTDVKEIKRICYEEKPDVILNTAAMTDVDACEQERKKCWDANVIAVENLASAAKVLDCHLIAFSTDYIFDGVKGPYPEDGRPDPLSYYGKSKHACENICIGDVNKSTIVRTNVVYGQSSYGKTDFIQWVAENLKEEKELNIITGQFCNPTLTDDIAYGLIKIIDKVRYGIYNFAGNDWLNRYEIALKIAEVFELNSELIKPMAPVLLKQKATRPERGGLVNLKAETDLGIKFSDLETGMNILKNQLQNKY